MNDFSNKLKKLRKNKNWTQEYVAKKLNCSRACYSHWENGRTEPNIEEIIKLANLFNCKLEFLLSPTENNSIVFQEYDYEQMLKKYFHEIAHDDTERKLFEGVHLLNKENKKKILELVEMYLKQQKDFVNYNTYTQKDFENDLFKNVDNE